MKKLTLSVIAAGIAAASAGAYAAVPTGAAPFQVVVPNLKSGVTLIAEGLYLQPTNSDLSYALLTTGTSPNNNVYLPSVKPKYDFGFRAGLGYIFSDSGNDVQVAWTHFDHTTNASTAAIVSGSAIQSSSSDVNFKYDAVDLDVGQYLSMGTRLQTRFFVGLRGVQLQNDTNNDGIVTSLAGAVDSTENIVTHSKFTGVGPRVGIDTSYHVANCFGIAAHFATTLLVGTVETSAVDTTSSFTPANQFVSMTTNFSSNNQTRVVPGFDAKLGVNYSIPFKTDASSGMTIEAGYQVTHYADAIDRMHVLGTGFAPAALNSIVTSSIGFNGPYLSLNFKI